MAQLAALRVMVDTLGLRQQRQHQHQHQYQQQRGSTDDGGSSRRRAESSPLREIQVIAQDPAFNSLDVRLLRDAEGIEVLSEPQAWTLIDETTFLYAPHCERSVLLPNLRGRRPGLLVCNCLEQVVDG
ncbi:MAG: hypothetical protein M1825_002025 [Sarcosagium campestre]|nr:MAG: hypothetical protein M1825_002025 [Sarcosagium campestre]